MLNVGCMGERLPGQGHKSYRVMLREALRDGPWELVGFDIDKSCSTVCGFCQKPHLRNLCLVRRGEDQEILVVGSKCGPNLSGHTAELAKILHDYADLPVDWQDARPDFLTFIADADLSSPDTLYELQQRRREMAVLVRAAQLPDGAKAVEEILEGPIPLRQVLDLYDPIKTAQSEVRRIEKLRAASTDDPPERG